MRCLATGSSPVLLANRGAWNREGDLEDSRPFVFSAPGLLLRCELRHRDVSRNPGGRLIEQADRPVFGCRAQVHVAQGGGEVLVETSAEERGFSIAGSA